MAINQTKKQSDLEKRFLKLSQQLSGKSIDSVKTDKEAVEENRQSAGKFTFNASTYTPQHTATSSDLSHLRSSLIKITTLSALAIGTEVLLYFLAKSHYINLNF